MDQKTWCYFSHAGAGAGPFAGGLVGDTAEAAPGGSGDLGALQALGSAARGFERCSTKRLGG